MKRIAVLTSGGDAPGMNSAVRAVARTGMFYNMEVYGIRSGYKGLIDNDIFKMNLSSVGDIIQRGGTFLFTARSEEFMTPEGRKKAFNNLLNEGIDGLVVIGGDGSFRGALELEKMGVKVIGVPGTIDNDIFGTEYTIGFDTAVNNVIGSIDKIRDTATSHERIFIIEVMGRNSGWIALKSGISGGAESVLIPEISPDYDLMSERIARGITRGKRHSIIIVAEGVASAYEVAEELKKRTELESRVVVLGHTQRGGAPSANDRYLSAKMGYTAVQYLREGKSGLMTALVGGEIVGITLKESVENKKDIDINDYDIAALLAI